MQQNRMQLNIGICDDEPVMVKTLAELCESVLQGQYALNLLQASAPAELLVEENPLQIALVDVQLVEASGIDLARDLLQRNPGCRIIFVSGYLHAVSEVYEVPHFCFVLKDQLQQQLPRFLLRAAQLTAQEAGQTIDLAAGRRTERLPLSELTVMERRGHSTFVTLRDGSILQTREKLSSILDRIRNEAFLRCHISYAVNLREVVSLDGRSFRMRSGQTIPISRPNEQLCRDAFFRYLSETVSGRN